MKKNICLISGIFSYVVSFFIIIYYFIIEFSLINVFSPIYRLGTIIVIIFFMHIGGSLLKKTDNSLLNKVYKLNLYIWFLLYMTMLLNLTLFDKYFDRQVVRGSTSFSGYISSNFNIIPFKTINNFFVALGNNNLRNSTFIYNIFGNIAAFAPLALFIPRIFKSVDKWYKYFIVCSLFIIFIEVMQMVMRCGSCDIDDYILNIFGTMLLYFIVNIKFIKNMIDKHLFLKEGLENE